MHMKAPVLESLFSKPAGLKTCNFIKKRLQHSCFHVNIVKFFRTSFFIEHLWWLLLQSSEIKDRDPANIYLFKVINRNSRKGCENMLEVNNKDARATTFWCRNIQLWAYFTHFSSVCVIDFEQGNVCWGG